MVLDTLCRVSFQDNAGKSPDFLELPMGHQPPTYNGVSNGDRPVRNSKDSYTVVRQQPIPYDGESKPRGL